MRRNKFSYKCEKGAIFDLDWNDVKASMVQWEEGELIIRKKISWDTDQMRKYFHGPVLKFVVEQLKGCGHTYGKDEVKQYLKERFGGKQEVSSSVTGKVFRIPASTAEYDFKKYTDFLNDINAWCIECFLCELPPAEQVE